tara:strand:+ start:55627 stop:57303 length:1677 start_codon:yes stop_codon:yes gene_type:complete
LINLILTDKSLYCSQWDYQNEKPVLFSFIKVDFHSSLSSIRNDYDKVQNNLRTALLQIDDLKNIRGTAANIAIDFSLTEKDSIAIGDMSEREEIEQFLLWTIRTRWGKQIDHLSYSFLLDKSQVFYFSFSKLILSTLTTILNEIGFLHISYQPIETLFLNRLNADGVLFSDKKGAFLFCDTKWGLLSCKISIAKDELKVSNIIGDRDKLIQLINGDQFTVLLADGIKTKNLAFKNWEIIEPVQFQNVITESVSLTMDISQRIYNAIDSAILKYDSKNRVNYFLNPFINIVDLDSSDTKKRTSDTTKKINNIENRAVSDSSRKDPVQKLGVLLLLILITGLIVIKNSESEKWIENLKNRYINNESISETMNTDVHYSDSTKIDDTIAEERNQSYTILNSVLQTFNSLDIKNIIYINSTDNIYRAVILGDTLIKELSMLGQVDSLRKSGDSLFKADIKLYMQSSESKLYFHSINDVLSILYEKYSTVNHRILESIKSDKFIYDPLILSFSYPDSQLDILNVISHLGKNILIRKIEYKNPDKTLEKYTMTFYLSVLESELN